MEKEKCLNPKQKMKKEKEKEKKKITSPRARRNSCSLLLSKYWRSVFYK